MVPEPARVGIGRTRASTPVPPTSPIVSPVSHIPPPCPSPASQPPPQSSPLWEDDGDERNGDGADAVSISHAACGQLTLFYCLLWNRVRSWSNQHGELGLGHTRSTRVFEPMLKLPIHSRVRQLAAGQHFSLLMFRDANASSVGTTASQPNLELRSGRLFLWKSVPLARRIVQLGFGGAEWKSRYAVLSCASLQFFRDPTESQPEFTLPLGPELRVVARIGSCGSSEAASSTATSVATSVSSASVEVADEELVQFSIWKLTPRVSSIANAAPEMSLVIRLKAKSERRRRKWVQALRRGIAAHRPNPRSRSMALAATGRKAATRDDNYAETWRTRILPEMRKGGVYPAKEVSSQELLRRGIPNRLRGSVWPLAIGNSLRITGELFAIYRERGASQQQRFAIVDEPSPRNVIGAGSAQLQEYLLIFRAHSQSLHCLERDQSHSTESSASCSRRTRVIVLTSAMCRACHSSQRSCASTSIHLSRVLLPSLICFPKNICSTFSGYDRNDTTLQLTSQ